MELVKIIHPDTGGIAEVPQSSLPHLYASGWRLLADDEAPPQEQAPEPEPMTKAQAAKATSQTATSKKTQAAESEEETP